MKNETIVDFATLCNFQSKQMEAENVVLNTDAKYVLYGGSAAGGKSYFLRWIAIELGLYYAQKYKIRGIPIGLFSEDYPTLKDRQISRIKRELPTWLGELRESRDEGYVFQISERFGGARVLLRNLDDPSKYASTEFAAICVEELTKNTKDTFDDLRFRLRYPGVSDPKFVAATNPGGVGHGWVKSLWVASTPESRLDPEFSLFKFIQAKVSDNKYVDESYVRQLQSLPEQKRKAFLDGSWEVFAGQFFSEWSESIHVVKSFKPTKSGIVIGGMDWGRTNPFALELDILTKVIYKEQTFYRSRTFCEVYGTDKKPSEWDTEIKRKLALLGMTLSDISWVRADPKIFAKGDDGSKSIRDQFVDADERWRTILKPANNDRIIGWNLIHDWLSLAPDGMPYWQVSESCSATITTVPNLIHDDNVVEDVETSRKFGIDDDAGDAHRYKFKHLKWLDGKIGGFGGSDKREEKKPNFLFTPEKTLTTGLKSEDFAIDIKQKRGVYIE